MTAAGLSASIVQERKPPLVRRARIELARC